jgi:MFS family permease
MTQEVDLDFAPVDRSIAPMTKLVSAPGTSRVLGASIIARLPLPMLGIGLLVHIHALTGSFAAAGVVAGAYAIATGVGGPVLGRLVDRGGQTRALLVSTAASAVLLAAIAVLPAGAPLPVLIALASGIGLATPPAGACVRALLPSLWPDPETMRKAYALDATAVELTWVCGPPLALGLGALLSTGAALAAAGGLMVVGTVAFAAQPVSRNWRPLPAANPQRGGSLAAPGMRTLVMVLVAVGVLFGSVEVAVAATTEALGSAALGGPLLGLWGLGSLVGGVIATRRGGGANGAAGLSLVLVGLAGGHLLLVAAAGNAPALAATLLVAGAAIAPAYASVYGMVERIAPHGAVTEAFAWLATATAVGTAAGAALAGPLAEHAGPTSAFVLASGAGLLAVLLSVLRARSLSEPGAELIPIPAWAGSWEPFRQSHAQSAIRASTNSAAAAREPSRRTWFQAVHLRRYSDQSSAPAALSGSADSSALLSGTLPAIVTPMVPTR